MTVGTKELAVTAALEEPGKSPDDGEQDKDYQNVRHHKRDEPCHEENDEEQPGETKHESTENEEPENVPEVIAPAVLTPLVDGHIKEQVGEQ